MPLTDDVFGRADRLAPAITDQRGSITTRAARPLATLAKLDERSTPAGFSVSTSPPRAGTATFAPAGPLLTLLSYPTPPST